MSHLAIRRLLFWRAVTSTASVATLSLWQGNGCRFPLPAWRLWGSLFRSRFLLLLGLLGLVPFAGGIACAGLAIARNNRACVTALGATAVAFTTMFFAIGAQRADLHQQNHLLLAAIGDHSPAAPVASYRVLEPSWVFYSGQPILELPRRNTPIVAGTHATTAAWLSQFAPPDQAAQFLAAYPQGRIITTAEHYQKLAPHLPHDVGVLVETQRFLKDDRLVVLGRQWMATQVATQPGVNGAR
jgi:hypothetical protein